MAGGGTHRRPEGFVLKPGKFLLLLQVHEGGGGFKGELHTGPLDILKLCFYLRLIERLKMQHPDKPHHTDQIRSGVD